MRKVKVFDPGPPTTPKGGFFGHHRFAKARKRFRLQQTIARAHAEALRENEKWQPSPSV